MAERGTTVTVRDRVGAEPVLRAFGYRHAASVRHAVGGFFLFTAGINVGLAAADPGIYREFAAASYLDVVARLWQDVVMAEPRVWALLLACGELAIGVLLLVGGRAARVGWVAVVAFHVLLMLFGFGLWWWSVPVLAVLVPVAVAEWGDLAGPRPGGHRA
jgi:hypothetical protein